MKRNQNEPLYYAIIRQFMDGSEHTAASILESLKSKYLGYKLFTAKGVEEALATAKENGLLDEANYAQDEDGNLATSYSITEFGRETVKKYLD